MEVFQRFGLTTFYIGKTWVILPGQDEYRFVYYIGVLYPRYQGASQGRLEEVMTSTMQSPTPKPNCASPPRSAYYSQVSSHERPKPVTQSACFRIPTQPSPSKFDKDKDRQAWLFSCRVLDSRHIRR
jgi:hypothetical protein